MKINDVIVDELNNLLVGELTAVDQYFIHSRMYEDWGLSKLYERINHEMQEEHEHADLMIKRILFLEGQPDLSKRDPLNVGSTLVQTLQHDLDLEYKVDKDLKRVIAICEQHNDYVTREMLREQLKDTEEDHAYWLEKQLGLIDKIGIENYMQSQI